MIKIAICDDDKIFCDEIEEVINNYERTISSAISIETFYSGEALIEYISDGNVLDLIFLDIELENINGVDVGKLIRNEFKNEAVQIVYISWNREYALELFKNRPFDFLIKPLEIEKVSEVINKYIEIYENENNFFEFKFGKSAYKIPFKDIMYFESENRKIKIVGRFGEKEYYEKLATVIEAVPKKEFVQIHKSIIVNCFYISNYTYEEIILSNGRKLPISQKFRVPVREELLTGRM